VGPRRDCRGADGSCSKNHCKGDFNQRQPIMESMNRDFRITLHLTLMVVLKSRFTNSLNALQLIEVTFAMILRTRPIGATTISPWPHRASTFSRLSTLLFFFVTCSSWIHCRREEDFLFLFRHLAILRLQDPRLPCPYLSPRFFSFEN